MAAPTDPASAPGAREPPPWPSRESQRGNGAGSGGLTGPAHGLVPRASPLSAPPLDTRQRNELTRPGQTDGRACGAAVLLMLAGLAPWFATTGAAGGRGPLSLTCSRGRHGRQSHGPRLNRPDDDAASPPAEPPADRRANPARRSLGFVEPSSSAENSSHRATERSSGRPLGPKARASRRAIHSRFDLRRPDA